MHNFYVVLKYSLKKKIISKSFLVFSVLILLASLLVFFSPAIAKALGSDEEVKIGVIAQDKNIDDALNEISALQKSNNKYVELKDTKELNKYVFIVDVDDKTIYTTSTDYNSATPYLNDLNAYFLREKGAKLGITPEDFQELLAPTEYKYETIKESSSSLSDDPGLFFLGYFLTIMAFMLIMFGMQFLGSEILEEKLSRSMEVIMTNMKPEEHMLGKILANFLFLFSIIVEVVVFVSLSIFLSNRVFIDYDFNILEGLKGIFANIDGKVLGNYLLIVVPLLFVTILIVFVIMSVLASTVGTREDYQTATFPPLILLFAAYFAGIAITNVSILKVLMYIPVINYFTMPNLYLQGQIEMSSALSSVGISVVTLMVLIIFGRKVYREGVLNYSGKKITLIMKDAFRKK